MKFQYKLQKVLDFKTNEKKQAEHLLSRSIGEMARLEREHADLLSEKLRVQEELAEQAGIKRTAAEMLSLQYYVDALDERIRMVKRKMALAERQVEEHRSQLKERTVEEKVWLKAREKAYELYRAEAGKRAQAETDEMALMRSRFAQ
jgi:flagellar FliJ protein